MHAPLQRHVHWGCLPGGYSAIEAGEEIYLPGPADLPSGLQGGVWPPSPPAHMPRVRWCRVPPACKQPKSLPSSTETAPLKTRPTEHLGVGFWIILWLPLEFGAEISVPGKWTCPYPPVAVFVVVHAGVDQIRYCTEESAACLLDEWWGWA